MGAIRRRAVSPGAATRIILRMGSALLDLISASGGLETIMRLHCKCLHTINEYHL